MDSGGLVHGVSTPINAASRPPGTVTSLSIAGPLASALAPQGMDYPAVAGPIAGEEPVLADARALMEQARDNTYAGGISGQLQEQLQQIQAIQVSDWVWCRCVFEPCMSLCNSSHSIAFNPIHANPVSAGGSAAGAGAGSR